MKSVSAGMVVATMYLAACATAESPDRTDVVLLRAHITSIDVGESLDQGNGEVVLGTRNAVSAVASEVLIGRMANRDFSIVLPMTSVPRLGGSLDEIFILAQVVDGGELRAVRWSFAMQGMCIDEDTARALDIEKEVSSLNGSGRLPC